MTREEAAQAYDYACFMIYGAAKNWPGTTPKPPDALKRMAAVMEQLDGYARKREVEAARGRQLAHGPQQPAGGSADGVKEGPCPTLPCSGPEEHSPQEFGDNAAAPAAAVEERDSPQRPSTNEWLSAGALRRRQVAAAAGTRRSPRCLHTFAT